MAVYDCSGYATRFDTLCSDGRTILKGAFSDDDGKRIPLVWNHMHDDPDNVLGHADLEERNDGMYAYVKFNNNPKAQRAKTLVEHGDISSFSIHANRLKQKGGNVLHGVIRELSLVLAGANPGASIETLSVSHSDDPLEDFDEAIIYSGEDFSFEHSDKEPEEKEEDDKEDTSMNENKTNELEHADNEKTVADVFNELNEEQKNVVYFMISQALEENGAGEGGSDMKHNVFDGEQYTASRTLTHADVDEIFKRAKKQGSLRDTVTEYMEENEIMHAEAETNGVAGEDYGITDIEYLFPEAKSLNTPPEFINKRTEWVAEVMNSVHHTPFSRIKSMFADITAEEARARGYIKGTRKKEEVFSLLKRTTDPQTIYKKQKLDRDDIIDITDFDVVSWIRGEMRIKLEEEIARAILFGDGRLASDDDKISEDHIRSVASEDSLFAVPVQTTSNITTAGNYTDAFAKEFIKDVIRSRKLYRGSGNPVLFISQDLLTEMLLIEDDMGRTIYESEATLATKLRVKKIVAVELMDEGLKTKAGDFLHAIMVNLNDYNVGADKGGQTTMFDDFDIDFNQYKYLLETRMSGALVKPYSAINFISTVAA